MSPILGIIASSKLVASSSYESIATATGTGSSGTITFSSIPSTYKHLQLRYIAQDISVGSAGTSQVLVQFNSDTGANYVRHYLNGDGSTAGAGGDANMNSMSIRSGMTYGNSTQIYAAAIIDLIDYASTSKNKTMRYFAGANNNTSDSSFRIVLGSGLWQSTSAVNTITLTSTNNNFSTGSVFSLYGIKGA